MLLITRCIRVLGCDAILASASVVREGGKLGQQREKLKKKFNVSKVAYYHSANARAFWPSFVIIPQTGSCLCPDLACPPADD